MSVTYLDRVTDDAAVQELMKSSKKPVREFRFNVDVTFYLNLLFRFGLRTIGRRLVLTTVV
jgi:hypothetical protein